MKKMLRKLSGAEIDSIRRTRRTAKRERKIRLTKKEVFALTHCPNCKGDLYTLELLWGSPYSYCPKCDLVKMSLMSMPWLCSECDSKLFASSSNYNTSEGEGTKCFLCGGSMRGMGLEKFHKQFKKGKLRRGYYVSERSLPKRLFKTEHCPCHNEGGIILNRHNKRIFKYQCRKCSFVSYISLPEWRQQELGIEHADIYHFVKRETNEISKNTSSN